MTISQHEYQSNRLIFIYTSYLPGFKSHSGIFGAAVDKATTLVEVALHRKNAFFFINRDASIFAGNEGVFSFSFFYFI